MKLGEIMAFYAVVEISNARSLNIFKNSVISEKKESSSFSVHDPLGAKRLTCLRFKFSHLNEHKFRYGFDDTLALAELKLKPLNISLCDVIYTLP